MGYKNAVELLPPDLLSDIQKYFSGGIIYIPKNTEKAGWGQVSGSKRKIECRNIKIKELFKSGNSIEELSRDYFLSIDSIKKIVYKSNK